LRTVQELNGSAHILLEATEDDADEG
jgi:hypothetical protein